jgi:hypothetical protein
MARRISTFATDDGDCDCDGPQQVGAGCAQLSPHEDTVGLLHYAAKVALKMRKTGATYVKVGDLEVSWQEPTSSGQDGSK